MIKIGVVREGKVPTDNRVPFSPEKIIELKAKHPKLDFIVQPSDVRCYSNEAYAEKGIEVQEDLSTCDYLFGVKEVRLDDFIPGKPYFFFSHTKKAQPYNKPLMKKMIAENVRMIDYECLTHKSGDRILGFGYWAGVVGAHNGLLTYGKKYERFELPAAHSVENYDALKKHYAAVNWPAMKIALTGGGRVASGVLEIMKACGFQEVDRDSYMRDSFDKPVFVHLDIEHLYARMDDSSFERDDFFKNPQDYTCLFKPFTRVTDTMMNGIYWDTKIPPHFKKEDIQDERYKMNVISDITCDADGSIPINLGASTIPDPVYGIDKKTFERAAAFQNTDDIIDLMTVDNLPSELPTDASEHFGEMLGEYIIPEILLQDRSEILEDATICENGELKEQFAYLKDYAFG